jgi:hypothetical protein
MGRSDPLNGYSRDAAGILDQPNFALFRIAGRPVAHRKCSQDFAVMGHDGCGPTSLQSIALGQTAEILPKKILIDVCNEDRLPMIHNRA